MSRGLEGDKFHPVNFAFTNETGGPSSDGIPDPAILEMVRNFRGKVLDVGSGDGRYTTAVLAQGVDVVAADLNTDALVTLRDFRSPEDEGALHPVRLNAFAPLPFKDKVFDGAMSTALLHLRPPEHIRSSLEEMARVTKRGGLLVVDLSTDIERVYTSGERAGQQAKGSSEVSYSLDEGGTVLRDALKGLFAIKQLNRSDMSLDLTTKDGPVHLTTKKINVLGERI